MSARRAKDRNDGYYLRLPEGHPIELWQHESHTLTKLGLTNPPSYAAVGRTNAFQIAAKNTPWFDQGNPFVRLDLTPGSYHPRIARPGALSDGLSKTWWCPDTDLSLVATNRSQAEVLTQQLEKICRTVHPIERNFDTYGHDISNLLILASTEVEMNWRGILVANGNSATKNTNEYFKLADALGLRSYAITYPQFPWLDAISPFADWDRSDPTGSLPWFAAYHGVKHNREIEFERATLRHAFEAVTACVILLAAQFGRRHALGHQSDLSRFFHFEREPAWPSAKGYCFPIEGDWTPVAHPALS